MYGLNTLERNNMLNIRDIQALIAFAVMNNKLGVIQAMNNTGNFVPFNISDTVLFDAVLNVYETQGLNALKIVLNQVALDRSKLTQDEARNLFIKYNNLDPATAKFSLDNIGKSIGDFLSGTTVVNQTGGTLTSTSVLSPTTLTLIVVIGIILMIIFRKFVAVVIGIIVIIAAVVAYGIFARNISQTGPTGTTTVHEGALGWLAGVLNGLNLSIVGK